MRRQLLFLLFLIVLASAKPALAVEVHGQGRVWAGPGFDTNARRDFTTLGVSTAPDLFGYLLGSLEGQLLGGDRRAGGAYDVGARKFVFLPSEDTVLQSVQLEGLQDLSRSVSLGVLGRVRDRRGAERDYTDLEGGVVLDFVPDERLDARLRVSAHRFLFYNRFAYSHYGPDFAVNARYRFNRRHSLSVFGGLNPRTFNAIANANPSDEAPPDPPPIRGDAVLQVGLQYAYRGSWQFSAGYAYLDTESNSFGETLRRHRFTVTAGVRLPARFMLLATGVLQLTKFPDGVYLSPDLQVVEDDENSSSVTLKLVRPLGEHVDLDLRYALYVNVLPANNFLYFRQVFSGGLSVSF